MPESSLNMPFSAREMVTVSVFDENGRARKNQLQLHQPIVLKFIDATANVTNHTICAFYDMSPWLQKLMWSSQGCWLDLEKEGKFLTSRYIKKIFS